jgi:hypothetical protein
VNAILLAHQEINPVGRKLRMRIGREWNKFNGDGEYEITSTGLQPLYKDVNFTRVELQWKEHLPLFFKNHTLSLSARGGSILGPPVDEFFDFYAGGLVGMKGYPFYAIGGNEMAAFGIYRFPSCIILMYEFFSSTLINCMSVHADAGYA